jgi:C1A family cysteine protease
MLKLTFIVLAALALSIDCNHIKQKHAGKWRNHLNNNKNLEKLSPEELEARYSNFAKKADMVEEHSKKVSNNEENYTIDVNHLSHLSDEEFKSTLGVKLTDEDYSEFVNKASQDKKKKLRATVTIPSEFSWKAKGMMTPPRDQGMCGGCWAFSSVAVFETMYAISTNTTPVYYSVEQEIDCSYVAMNVVGNHGCNGGLPIHAYKYANTNAIVPDSQYTYAAYNGAPTAKNGVFQACATTKAANGKFKVMGYYNLLTEADILAQLQSGPVTAAINVEDSLQMYTGGVYSSPTCTQVSGSQPVINHAVVITGYGVDTKTGAKFWEVRNSWSNKWGEGGYFRIKRGVNMCSIESLVQQPTL